MAENPNWVNVKFVCSCCRLDGVLKVSRSNDNPNRVYGKCPSKPCSKFLGWLDECQGKHKQPAVEVDSLPQDDNPELLELKEIMSEAMMLVYMCRNDVRELVMVINNLIEEVAVLRNQVVDNVQEVKDLRQDVAHLKGKAEEMTRDMAVVMEKVTDFGKEAAELKKIWEKVFGLLVLCGMGIGGMVVLVIFMVLVVIFK